MHGLGRFAMNRCGKMCPGTPFRANAELRSGQTRNGVPRHNAERSSETQRGMEFQDTQLIQVM